MPKLPDTITNRCLNVLETSIGMTLDISDERLSRISEGQKTETENPSILVRLDGSSGSKSFQCVGAKI